MQLLCKTCCLPSLNPESLLAACVCLCQLLVALAGRAGEEVVYGRDEMSSLNQSRNMLARQIASKMLNAGEHGRAMHACFQQTTPANLRTLAGTNRSVCGLVHAGMSEHPDFENLRGLGSNWYDASFEPNRWTSYTVITDMDQTRSEWIDMDMEMELKINNAYEEVKDLIQRNRCGRLACVGNMCCALGSRSLQNAGQLLALICTGGVLPNAAGRAWTC